MLTTKSDEFYAIFVRVDDDDSACQSSNQYSLNEAMERAKWLANRNPHNEYFVMKTVSKCTATVNPC
jgi:hypothetical protein